MVRKLIKTRELEITSRISLLLLPPGAQSQHLVYEMRFSSLQCFLCCPPSHPKQRHKQSIFVRMGQFHFQQTRLTLEFIKRIKPLQCNG